MSQLSATDYAVSLLARLFRFAGLVLNVRDMPASETKSVKPIVAC